MMYLDEILKRIWEALLSEPKPPDYGRYPIIKKHPDRKRKDR